MNKASYATWGAQRGPVGSLFTTVMKDLLKRGLLKGMTPDEQLLAVAAFIKEHAQKA